MGLNASERLEIAYDRARGEMRFKLEDVEYIEQALDRAKKIEAALVLISAQSTREEIARYGMTEELYDRGEVLDKIIEYARKTLNGKGEVI